VLFVYIGLNLLRKIFFGRTPNIWHENIPQADAVLLVADAIEVARLDNDLVKEELLFLALIDLLRSPDRLRTYTRSIFADREDMFYLDSNK
jgi:hypothetical protein